MVLPLFANYPWPGNVREMENVIERVAVYCSRLDAGAGIDVAQLKKMIPELFSGTSVQSGVTDKTQDLRLVSKDGELAHILKVIKECGGSHVKACKRLRIGRTTLWRKLNQKP